jgi:hypothetical protein
MTDDQPLVLKIGRHVCRDCRAIITPPRMYRCADCLAKRIDRIKRQARR